MTQKPSLAERSDDTILRLSNAQAGIWFAQQLQPSAPAFYIGQYTEINGSLDKDLFLEALRRVSVETDVLKARVSGQRNIPQLIIGTPVESAIEFVDLSSEIDSDRAADKWMKLDMGRPPGPEFWRHSFVLFKLRFDHFTWYARYHHMLVDGFGMWLIAQRVAQIYAALCEGKPTSEAAFLPLRLLCEEDLAYHGSEQVKRDQQHWRKYLAGISPALSLSSKPAKEPNGFLRATSRLEAASSNEIRSLLRNAGASLVQLVTAGTAILLHRMTGAKDIVIGVTVAARSQTARSIPGMASNIMPIRLSIDPRSTVRELIAQVDHEIRRGLDHQQYQIHDIRRDLSSIVPDGSIIRTTVNVVRFNYDLNFTGHQSATHNLAFGWVNDLSIAVHDRNDGDGIRINFDANPALYEQAELSSHHQRFIELLNTLKDLEASIGSICLIAQEERYRLLKHWHGPVDEFRAGCVHEVFEERARCLPTQIAVRHQGRSLTYEELDRRANRLAWRLRNLGVGRGCIVGLCVGRSMEMVVALLGILKAGAAYLPLDPNGPEERTIGLIQESDVKLLITDWRATDAMLTAARMTLRLDEEDKDCTAESEEAPHSGVHPDDLAYVIYTSGSTGRPKGVMVRHGAVVNLLRSMANQLPIRDVDVALAVTPITFDISVLELLGPLSVGACVVIADRETVIDGNRLATAISDSITVLQATPSTYRMLAAAGWQRPKGLKLLVGGEALPPDLAGSLLEGSEAAVLWNLYGPTETTIWSTAAEVIHDADITIGRPILNTQTYVLDARMEPVPIGVAGELWIGGSGLARGYLNRPGLTAERFVPSPFGIGERLYRTGDVAKWRPDGRLEYLGRIDAQIKLRGYRIEPGEIEAMILQSPEVQDVVVLARGDDETDKRLVAYIVPQLRTMSDASNEQPQQWQAVFDTAYEVGAADPLRDFATWKSSFTGAPIPPNEMAEWVDRTVDRIRLLRPRRVLELGCGIGLLAHRLARDCVTYVGTDISSVAITRLERQKQHLSNLRNCRFYCRAAHDLSGLEAESFDTIVLNSVVQYFTSANALTDLVRRLVALVEPGGAIFIGDVRNLRLLTKFHTEVQLHQADAQTTIGSLHRAVWLNSVAEKELLLDPCYFTRAIAEIPGVGAVNVQLKRSAGENEISCYRYDVVIHAGPRPVSDERATRWDWVQSGFDIAALEAKLVLERPSLVVVVNIPNRRLMKASAWANLLGRLSAEATIGRAKEEIKSVATGVDPEALWRLGERLGYLVRVEWSAPPSDDNLTVILVDRAQSEATSTILGVRNDERSFDDTDLPLSNDPAVWKRLERLARQMPGRLEGRLPEYMIPTAFTFVDALPLTSSGKIDRRALPDPSHIRRRTFEESRATLTPDEGAVAAIFQQVLNLEEVGRDENFFRLGGHSLLAMQAVARIRERLGAEIPLAAFFKAPTPSAIAELVRESLSSNARSAPNSYRLPSACAGGSCPASFSQEGLWFLEQSQDIGHAYHMALAFRLQGPFDSEAFEQSMAALVARHEILRARFEIVDGMPTQVTMPSVTGYFSSVDISDQPQRECRWQQQLVDALRRGFELDRGPLFRVQLLRMGPLDNIVAIIIHHIASDEHSLSVMVDELGVLYRCQRDRRASSLPELSAQYSGYALWQRERLKGALLESQLGYWVKHLDGIPDGIELPTDRPRPSRPSYRGETISFSIPEDVGARLKDFASREGVTLFMVLLAAFQVLLSRWSSQYDVVVGAPISDRRHSESQGLIGLFINMLPLRTNLAGNPSFREVVARVRDVCLDAYAHQDSPFEKIVEALKPHREAGRHPIFQTCFVLLNSPSALIDLPEVVARSIELDSHTSKFDLTLNIRETPSALLGTVEYAVDLFLPETIDRFCSHFLTLLSAVVADADHGMQSLTLLTRHECELFQSVNSTRRDYPTDARLNDLFELQAKRTPDAIAAICGHARLTYGELDRRSNQVANYLQWLGVGPEVVVGICVRRSFQMLIALLGVLKAGGAYLPLDPTYPSERIAFMLEDSQAPIVIAEGSLSSVLPKCDVTLVDLDRQGEEIFGRSAVSPHEDSSSGHLAYVIYTSGSTGKPKGVAVSHRSAVAFVKSMQEKYSEEEMAGTLLSTSLCFDVSVFEIFLPLCSGATIIISDSVLDLGELPAKNAVTMISTVPSVMRELLRTGQIPNAVQTITLAGEALDAQLVRDIYRGTQAKRVWNAYGPTECTVYATAILFPPDVGSSVIGCPIANTKTYVLDAHLEPAPIGIPGELYIGGDGLARGYFNRPALTADRFIPDPFGEGTRLYRTGDLVRWRANGNLEFLGRTDHQVKVRGFRIELGEIEAELLKHPSIERAIVVAQADRKDEKRLIAYLTIRAERAKPTSIELRSGLRRILPEYMMPSHFVFLDQFPLTATGKLDRKALPAVAEPVAATRSPESVASSPIEEVLVDIWSDVLSIDNIDVDDDFFDLGGHSLLALRLVARIRERLGVELRPSVVFQTRKISALADLMAERKQGDGVLCSLKKGKKGKVYLLHATDGDVLSYSEFVKALGEAPSVYGIRVENIAEDTERHLSLAQLAGRYADVICNEAVDDQVSLVGWSFGGLLAFEIAQQMVNLGRSPSFVGLIDTYHPTQLGKGCFDADTSWRQIVKTRISQHDDTQDLREMAQAHKRHWRAMCEYEPTQFPGQIHFYEAQEVDEFGFRADVDRWEQLAVRGVTRFRASGSHFSMMQPPKVADLAAQLETDILERHTSWSPSR
jgi:amino acid adenylation domain-containing protein